MPSGYGGHYSYETAEMAGSGKGAGHDKGRECGIFTIHLERVLLASR